MNVPPYLPRINEWRDLPEAVDTTEAGEEMIVRATDVNGWQRQLSLLTDASNANHAAIQQVTGSVGVLSTPQTKGTMLAHNGTSWQGHGNGGYGQFLTPDNQASGGASWLRPLEKVLSLGETTLGTPTMTVDFATHNNIPPEIKTRDFPVLYRSPDGNVYVKESTLWLSFYAYSNASGSQKANGTLGVVIPPGYRPLTTITQRGGVLARAWELPAIDDRAGLYVSGQNHVPLDINLPGLYMMGGAGGSIHATDCHLEPSGIIRFTSQFIGGYTNGCIIRGTIAFKAGVPLWRWKP